MLLCSICFVDVGEKWILKSLFVPMSILEGGYHLSRRRRNEVVCWGSCSHDSIRLEGAVLRGFGINYYCDVDDVCVIYMKHIYRLRSLILGGAPSFQGGPESGNTYSMWLFSCNAQPSCVRYLAIFAKRIRVMHTTAINQLIFFFSKFSFVLSFCFPVLSLKLGSFLLER